MASPSLDALRRHRVPLVVVLATLVLLRNRAFKRKKDHSMHADRLSPEDLAKAVQQLYVDEPDGSRSLLVPFRGRVSKVSSDVLLKLGYQH